MAHTMLLTKRLTTFLAQNTTPQLPTLLLISPSGKLLASSSPLPASRLRTQATLACTLWNLYQPLQSNNSEALTDVLEASQSPHSKPLIEERSVPTISADGAKDDQCCITIQLTDGVMVIRGLKCQLLFVAIGTSPSSAYPASPTLHAQSQHLSSSSLGSPPSSPTPQHIEGHDNLSVRGYGDKDGRRDASGSILSYQGSTAASDTHSMASTVRRAQANIMLVKRQADEVGKWLEKNLDGFELSPGELR